MTPTGRRFRLWFANVPLLSYAAFRWQVLYGSEVVDFAMTKHKAENRAKAFSSEGGWTFQRHNSTSIEPVR